MATDHTQAWAYTEDLYEESPIIASARQVAREYGIPAISAATGAFLQTFAAAARVRSAVEIGTGTGVSGLYLLGASVDLSLTSIDVEAEAQITARNAFTKMGIRSGRTRLINGRSADILPRLAARSYDLVLIDGDPLEAAGDAQEALRMLRPGGAIILAHALMGGRVADPARREDEVVAIRNLGREFLESAEMRTSIIPVGDGLLVALPR
ncbi:class I SAM-dependent methyltransferase [Arcanobacterium haemolyticum]|nr:class I SAM-dependent methyltransferase [Arcanobacterium haemolyticum]